MTNASFTATNQMHYLLPEADIEIDDFSEVDEDLVNEIAKLEPFGNANPEPVLKISNVAVSQCRVMGTDGQHVKLALSDKNNKIINMLAFNAPSHFFCEPGDVVTIWFQPNINDWRGNRSVEGRLLHIEGNN